MYCERLMECLKILSNKLEILYFTDKRNGAWEMELESEKKTLLIEKEYGKRNTAIDFLRVVFAVVILLYHSSHLYETNNKPVFQGGYLAVEFFFILSGAFMAKAALAGGGGIGNDTYFFMKKKISAIFPVYCTAFCVAFLAEEFLMKASLKKFISNAVNSLWPFLLGEMSGVDGPGFSLTGAWYISAMLIAMLILYPLLRWNFELTSYVLAPLCILAIYGNIYQTTGHLSIVRTYTGIFYAGVFRAVAGLFLGVITFCIACNLQKRSFSVKKKLFFTAAELAGYNIVLWGMYVRTRSGLDFSLVIILAGTTALTLSRKTYSGKVTNKRVSRICAGFSFTLYLIHSTVYIWIARFPFVGERARLLVYLAVSIAMAAILYLLNYCAIPYIKKRR